MAYITGQVASNADLQQALFDGVSQHGWSVTGNIIHKGNLYFQITIDTAIGGLFIQGGTGMSGGALTEPGLNKPRAGRFRTNETPNVWPSSYFLMIHDNPDEVYLFHRFGLDTYTWLSFGKSTLNCGGTGAWYSARSFQGASSDYQGQRQPCNMGVQAGGSPSQSSWVEYYPAGGMFWHTESNPGNQYTVDSLHCNLSGTDTWLTGASFNAIQCTIPHYGLLPSAWNMESVLLPMQAVAGRGESKNSMLIDLAHARYVRIDNHDPEQVITIGHEKWKIFPWVRKYMPMRDGPKTSLNSFVTTGGSHSGTMGLAVRYDGV